MLLLLETVVSSSIIAITIWFFFIQSPFLFSKLGRKKFVPIMMQMTSLYFSTIFITCVVLFLLSLINSNFNIKIGSSVSLIAVTINKFLVVPNALAAGKRSVSERDGEESHSTVDFAVQGGSKTETKGWHQSVVAFVLLMTGGCILNLLL